MFTAAAMLEVDLDHNTLFAKGKEEERRRRRKKKKKKK